MLNRCKFSVDHGRLLDTLAASEHLLIVQDLDGVCMGLVRNPLTRRVERRYLDAARRLAGAFYVLTNGEHIGSRGMNRIVDRALGDEAAARDEGLYLPGLAGGGVQWQDRHGRVSHPGISEAEMRFLRAVPDSARRFLAEWLRQPGHTLTEPEAGALIACSVLDNLVSPTVNINGFHHRFRERPEICRALQQAMAQLMGELLAEAEAAGLGGAFFIHYAPNLGRGASGERLKPAMGEDAGTTDFQFMVAGALKEVGVLALLNRYYHDRGAGYPLGEDFNARNAPRGHDELLALAAERFDPGLMPRIVGVGDTVTSQPAGDGEAAAALRGGSDRGFLTLIQEIGGIFATDNVAVFVDSSGGEVRRPGLDAVRLERAGPEAPDWPAVSGISDPDDPLRLNFVFPGGHRQYVEFFCQLAARAACRVRR